MPGTTETFSKPDLGPAGNNWGRIPLGESSGRKWWGAPTTYVTEYRAYNRFRREPSTTPDRKEEELLTTQRPTRNNREGTTCFREEEVVLRQYERSRTLVVQAYEIYVINTTLRAYYSFVTGKAPVVVDAAALTASGVALGLGEDLKSTAKTLTKGKTKAAQAASKFVNPATLSNAGKALTGASKALGAVGVGTLFFQAGTWVIVESGGGLEESTEEKVSEGWELVEIEYGDWEPVGDRTEWRRIPGSEFPCPGAIDGPQHLIPSPSVPQGSGGGNGEVGSTRVRLGLDQVAGTEPADSFGFTNADGDQITVTTWADGTVATECTNGTTTVHDPDGSSRSVNDPLGGAPIYVAIDPGGSRVTELPNGKRETVRPDGTTSIGYPDGSSVTVHPDGHVDVTRPGEPPATGVTLDEAVARGHLRDVQLVSTGENLGPVAVLVGTCDGSVPLVYVPPSIITPGDPVTNQTMDTHPTVIDTATPGPIEVEIPGACRNDPALPPAPSGDTGISLEPTAVDDPTPHIPDIVGGAVDAGVIPGDLVGTPADTVQTLDQVTRWLRSDASPEQVVAFLVPRIPGTPQQKQEKAQEITDWGARLVDKTRNLDKQVAGVPEVPPT